MRIRRFFTALLAAALLLGGCIPAHAAYDMPYYIGVDLTNQIVTVYNTEDDTVARQMLCSSGINDSTPEGTFYMPPKGRASERTEWTWYDQYDSYVKFSTRIWHGYMFHSLPYAKRDESTLIEESARELGTPASHGCMRLRVDDARFIAQNCLVGTMVRIYKDTEKQEELRQLLLVSSYTGEGGMSYTEFLGYADDALGRGSGGTEVSDLQHRLRDLGYYDGDMGGRYDTDTIAAVKDVQADLGQPQSGVTTAELSELLYSENAPVSAGQITIQEGSSGPVVKRLQSALNTLGLYEGELDSVYDLDVADAVRRFQGVCNFKVDGVATPEIQQALYYVLSKLEATFGAGTIPAAEIVTEEIQMATLRAEANIVVRSKPDTSSDYLAKLHDGDTMFVEAVEGDWAKIQTGSVTGFLRKKYLEPFTQENVILSFRGDDGTSYTIGHTMEEYRSGAQSLADEFAAYSASLQGASAQDGGDSAEAELYVAVNTGSDDVTLNLRAQANPDGEILAQVPNGTELRALGAADGWTQVSYGGQTGYLLNDYLHFPEDDSGDEESEPEEAKRELEDMTDAEAVAMAVVICGSEESAPVYAADSEDAELLGNLTEGVKLEVLAMSDADDWVCIRHEGRVGYMLDANLQFQLM